MRQEMILFRTVNNQPNKNNNISPADEPIEAVRKKPVEYYPDLEKVCRYLNFELTDTMETKIAKEWSLETLVRIMSCSWILQELPLRPEGISAGEAQQIRIAIMDKFQRRIPDDIKVVLPVDVDDPVVPP